MTYNPALHHRRSIRLKDYDYSQAGAYFITLCTAGRECLFGEIVDGDMHLNPAGRMVQNVWDELPMHYPGIEIDAGVVMPNHLHGITVINSVGATPRGHPDLGQARGPAPTGLSLPDVVHRFKTMTTKRYIDGVRQLGWLGFSGRLWQRNYYEHIIRDEASLTRIREYITNNPRQWALDRENPANSAA